MTCSDLAAFTTLTPFVRVTRSKSDDWKRTIPVPVTEVVVNIRLAVFCDRSSSPPLITVAVVTVPVAPLFNTILLFAGVGSNPKPLITKVAALTSKAALALVTTGATVATATAAELLAPSVVTIAVRLPADVGLVLKSTVIEVAVRPVALTVPTAPLLKVTEFSVFVVLKPNPLIVTEAPLAEI